MVVDYIFGSIWHVNGECGSLHDEQSDIPAMYTEPTRTPHLPAEAQATPQHTRHNKNKLDVQPKENI